MAVTLQATGLMLTSKALPSSWLWEISALVAVPNLRIINRKQFVI